MSARRGPWCAVLVVSVAAAVLGCSGGDDPVELSTDHAAQILEGVNLYGEPLRSPEVRRVVKNRDGSFSVFVENGSDSDLCFHIRLYDDGWSYWKCRN